MTSTFLSPDDERWSRALQELQHDVYHLPAYARVSALHEDGRPVAFFAEDESGFLLIPLLLRPLPETDGIDATSPYGYPAPLWTTSAPRPHWSAFVEEARSRGIVSAFVRLHPLLPVPDSGLADRKDTALVEHGPTVWIDCTQTPEELWNDTRPDHRSDIRRLLRLGYTLKIAGNDSSLSDALDEFRDLYYETMDRVDADPFYYFSDSYFDAWATALRSHCHVAVVRDENGEAASAGLFTNTDGWMQFHLSGTASNHRDLAPSKLMIHEVRIRANEANYSRLHLGGGLGAAKDSIFNFKAGFASLRATFRSLRVVFDREAYTSLCSDSPPPLSEGFFPAYRKG